MRDKAKTFNLKVNDHFLIVYNCMPDNSLRVLPPSFLDRECTL